MIKPYKFVSNNWSQEDYDNKVVHGNVNGITSKGTRDEELQEVFPFLSCKRNAIDVGARFGSYTRSCHTAGFEHVYAFELLEQFMPDFSRNIDLSRATVYNCGVLNKVGSFGRAGKRIVLEEGSTPTFTIDYFEFKNVDLIKIDIDSHDHLVLEGCLDTVKRCRPIVQMEWGSLQKRQNPTITEDMAWEKLKRLGYDKVGVSTNDNLILAPYELFS